MTLRLMSWFAGIGGAEVALRGIAEPVGQVEIDPWCCELLERRFPGVWRRQDVRDLGRARLPEADIWAGGFPCQDISPAGTGQGLRGARSSLFFPWMELIDRVRPPAVFIENHPWLRTRGLDVVLERLHAAVYDARWVVLSAWDVGAWHWRQRLWILAQQRDTAHGWKPTALAGFPPDYGELPADGVMLDGLVYRSRLITSGKPSNRYAVPTMRTTDTHAGRGARRGASGAWLRDGPSDAPVGANLADVLPTLTSSDGTGGGPGHGKTMQGGESLRTKAAQGALPTLTATEYGSGVNGALRHGSDDEKARPGAGAPSLNTLARQGSLPTLVAGDAKNAGSRNLPGSNAHAGTTLTDLLCRQQAAPTLSARDGRSGKGRQENGHAPQLPEVAGGVLNPTWCEPYMGYPIGWTDPELDADALTVLDLPAAWAGHAWLEHAGPPTLPPRTLGGRRQRIHGLGNAWVPQCARAAYEYLSA